MPIAGILIAMVVLVGEVVALKAYTGEHRHHHHRHHPAMMAKPHFGRHHGCADRLRISGPDDFSSHDVQPSR